ncbi:MAG: formate dehydrogenase subunit delta [Burkholderiales bacterium]
MSAAAVIEIGRLVEMANQIGDFFAPYPPGQRNEGIRNHLRHYWDPRMREALLAHLDAGGAGLTPHVAEAARQLRDPAPPSARAYAGPPKR